jgi:hypothetical protein
MMLRPRRIVVPSRTGQQYTEHQVGRVVCTLLGPTTHAFSTAPTLSHGEGDRMPQVVTLLDVALGLAPRLRRPPGVSSRQASRCGLQLPVCEQIDAIGGGTPSVASNGSETRWLVPHTFPEGKPGKQAPDGWWDAAASIVFPGKSREEIDKRFEPTETVWTIPMEESWEILESVR